MVKSEPGPGAIQVHDYRSPVPTVLTGALAVVVAGSGAFVLNFLTHFGGSGNGIDFAPNWLTAFVFAIFTIPFAALVVSFFHLLNESVCITGDEIIWRSRVGRVLVRCRLGDVTARERLISPLGFPVYQATTTLRTIRYGPTISRRAELDRLFIALLGGEVPEPDRAPRHWTGNTQFRCGAKECFTPLIPMLPIVLMQVVETFNRYQRATNYDRLFAAFYIGTVVSLVCFCAARCFFESVTVVDDELVFRNFLGRITARIRLDDITSVDAATNSSGRRIYTVGRGISVTHALRGVDELIVRLQRMTASPNP